MPELSCVPATSVLHSFGVKTLTIRLPDTLIGEIERESQLRRVTKSVVVRERLRQKHPAGIRPGTMRERLGDLIGSVRGLPADLSSNKKKYLPVIIRAKKLHRL